MCCGVVLAQKCAQLAEALSLNKCGMVVLAMDMLVLVHVQCQAVAVARTLCLSDKLSAAKRQLSAACVVPIALILLRSRMLRM